MSNPVDDGFHDWLDTMPEWWTRNVDLSKLQAAFTAGVVEAFANGTVERAQSVQPGGGGGVKHLMFVTDEETREECGE